MRFTVVTTTPHQVSQGSGTFITSITLQRTLERLGHTVRCLKPQRPPGALGHTVQRYAFNLRLSPGSVTDSDVVLGLDMDGFTLAGRVRPFVSYVLGVLADEATFEDGWVAHLLRLQANAERHATRQADLVITTSNYSRKRLAEVYGLSEAEIGVVPPAFDVERWQRDMGAVVTAPRDECEPVVFCAAHMYPRKNIAALVRATRILVEQVPGLSVRIAGSGPERRNINRLVAASGLERTVQLLGPLSHRRLLQEFAACDVFCLPSLQEGFGIVFLEAMASGKPVVACRASSTPELIEDCVNGMLASPGDDADLAAQLRRLIEDSALRSSMGETNRRAANRYAATVTVPRLVDLVARLTAG
ncbi:MAG: glycosyltransferase family 4 protein [Gemmatimonadota bacterium]|nr:MAG: glycosyltransferase family 4 protein [Gemmatimonadota bacterium]